MSLTNKPLSEERKEQTKGSVPKGEGDYTGLYGAPPVEYFQEFGDVSFVNYKFDDGSTGFAIFAAEWAFHVDNTNNFIFTAAPPSQGGCGGKMIQKSEAEVHKTGSISTHVTGRIDDGVTSSKVVDGNVEESKLPAYSLKVEGDVLIECVGGDAVVKGDSITLNALNTLNLKSGKDINLDAGGGSGTFNISAGKVKMDAAFFDKQISGRESTTGAGEVDIEQTKPGATTNINTSGSVNYTVNGDYNLGVTGEWKTIVNKNYALAVDKDYATTVKGNYSTVVEGKAKNVFRGVSKQSSQQETYILEVAAAKKNIPAYKIDSGGAVRIEHLSDGFEVETARGLSTLNLTEDDFVVTVGKNLGSVNINQKNATMSWAEQANVIASPDSVELEYTGNKVTVNTTGSTLEASSGAKVVADSTSAKLEKDGSSVVADTAGVRVQGTAIYLN